MAKRKNVDIEDEFIDDDDNSGAENVKGKARKAKDKVTPRVKKKKHLESDSESPSSNAAKPTTKELKLRLEEQDTTPPKEYSSIVLKTNSEGDKYVELGKKKRATVRNFKGQQLLDIREFYGEDGEEKPGKKGISLQPEQWEMLKNSANILDGLFLTLKNK